MYARRTCSFSRARMRSSNSACMNKPNYKIASCINLQLPIVFFKSIT